MRTLTSVLRSPTVPTTVTQRQTPGAPPTLPARRPGLAWRRNHTSAAPVICAAAGSYPGSSSGVNGGGTSGYPRAPPAAFNQLESLISQTYGTGGPGGDWRQVEECWVLYPPNGVQPKALVHFIGGAFVGAAPQLAYRPLLEALAARGALVVATPYATSFDHVAVADGVYFKFQRCLKTLGPTAITLPQFASGHSFGSLIHLLIFSRYVVPSAGSVLMSFNNNPATDSIPLLSPFIAPSLRSLGPLLSQLATSPLRSNVEMWVEMLKGASPPLVKQLVPILEQLNPIYMDVANGTQEFNPPPEETRRIIRQGYTVPRNLLIRFANDNIDQTPELASTLQSSAIANQLELTVKTLPGEHVRPLQQDLTRISPDLVRVANQAVIQSNDFWGQVTAFASRSGLPEQSQEQLSSFAKAAQGVASALGEAVLDANAGQSIETLADELAAWMGLPAVPSRQPVLVIPEVLPASPPPPPPAQRGGDRPQGPRMPPPPPPPPTTPPPTYP